LLEHVAEDLLRTYDAQNGGFGGAPKFPPHTAVAFLLNFAEAGFGDEDLRRRSLHVASHTLEAMCLGGLFDHVGGGFHRYSTDRSWHLPHFEKMLFDNGLMLSNLAMSTTLLPSLRPTLENCIRRTVDWLRREMLNKDGLLGSALDADSDGEEGKFYVWHAADLRRELGDDYEAFAELFGISESGNFQDEATRQLTGENLLHAKEAYGHEIAPLLDQLALTRQGRERPLFDYKAVIAWNAFAIKGLADCGETEFAQEIADRLLSFADLNALPRTIAFGKPQGRASLEDQAALVIALRALQLPKYESVIQQLADGLSRYLGSEGLYHSTTNDSEMLFGRVCPVFDQPAPSGNALAVAALRCAGRNEEAQSVVRRLAGWMERAPGATEALALETLRILQREQIIEPISVDWQNQIIWVQAGGMKTQTIRATSTGELLNVHEIDQNAYLFSPNVNSLDVEVMMCSPYACHLVRQSFVRA
jgi:uncharacterized protein